MKRMKVGKDLQYRVKPVLRVFRQALKYPTKEGLRVECGNTSREVSIWTQSLGEPRHEEIKCYRRA